MDVAFSQTRSETKSRAAPDDQKDSAAVVELHRGRWSGIRLAPRARSVIGRTLGQRKVVEWMLGYLGASFIVLEATDILGAIWGWSLVTQKVLCLVIALGFLPTLVVAWYHGAKGPQRPTLVEILLLAVLLLGSGAVLWRASLSGWGEATADEGSTSVVDGAPVSVAECIDPQSSGS